MFHHLSIQSHLLLTTSVSVREAEGEERGQPPTATRRAVRWGSLGHTCTENHPHLKFGLLGLEYALFKKTEHGEDNDVLHTTSIGGS